MIMVIRSAASLQRYSPPRSLRTRRRPRLQAQPKPGHLDGVLRQMDEASTKFVSAEANFRWDLYERVVKETTTQTGTIYFKR